MGNVFESQDDRAEDGSAAIATGNADRLIASEGFAAAVAMMSAEFVAIHEIAPRAAALFATQQRWLLCQAALAEHFRGVADGQPCLSRRRMAHLALQHGIASRNTAHAFFDEALKYGVIRPSQEAFVPSDETLHILTRWYSLHFRALDMLDGKTRNAAFLMAPDDWLVGLAPVAGRTMLSNPGVRTPGPLYTIFTWADAGGLLMDRLVAGIDRTVARVDGRLLTDLSSISYMARSFGLSRAHASRKIAEAESIDGIGWSGRRGHSRIWISHAFYKEYARAQAYKLLALDKAFIAAATQRSSGRQVSKMDSDDPHAFS
ncbi:hypothetical protein MAUB1S_06047 [Mycolicibacterium aubagnense]